MRGDVEHEETEDLDERIATGIRGIEEEMNKSTK